MGRVPSYLRKRVGKDRSDSRWYVRVPTPESLRSRFGAHVERSLGTSDKDRASDLAREKVVEIKRLFARAQKGGGLTPDEVKEARESELRRAYDLLAGNFTDNLDRLPRIAGELAEDAAEPVMAAINQNPLLGTTTAEYAEEIIKRIGAQPSERTVAELSSAILKAQVAAVAMIQRGIAPPAIATTHRVQRKGQARPISEAGKLWLAEMMQAGEAQWTKQTELQNGGTLRLFADFANNAPLDAITRADASAFLSALARLNADYGKGKKNKGKTLNQLLRDCSGEPGLTRKTLKRHASALFGLYRWCADVGHLPENHPNPFSQRQKRDKKIKRSNRTFESKSGTGWLPFKPDELEALFSHPLLKDATRAERVKPEEHSPRTALMWVPMVSLYSGMREDEICGLLAADIRTESGVHFFALEEHDGRRLKSNNAVRKVPVHSRLIRAGLLEYVAHVRKQGHAYLFPGLKPGGPDKKRSWYLSRAFTQYRRDVGVTRKRTSFHGLRKNFTECLDRAHVAQSSTAQLIGHERGFTYDTYSPHGLSVRALRVIVEKVKYPEVKL